MRNSAVCCLPEFLGSGFWLLLLLLLLLFLFLFVCFFFAVGIDLPTSTQTCTLGFIVGQSKEFEHPSFPAISCYSASSVVHSAKAPQSRAHCCGNLQLSLLAVCCDYRAVQDMMVKVSCKLMCIDITRSSYGRCTPYSRFRVSKPNEKRNPIFKKLLCSFLYFPSSLDWVSHDYRDFLGPCHTKNALVLSQYPMHFAYNAKSL